MPWIEEDSNVKFVCWGEKKDKLDEDDCIVVKQGESLEGIILSISENRDANDEVESYKYRLKVKDEEKEVLLWSNAAIKRQQYSLNLVEGEEIRLTYEGDYKAKNGKVGRNIKIAVNRKK